VQTSQLVHQAVEHISSILRSDLPEDLIALVQVDAHFPGLVDQLPFITVSAEGSPGRAKGVGHTIGLKRERVDETWLDLGYVTGDAGEIRFTLTLWAVTRPQLVRLRSAVIGIGWVRRERTWEEPAGVLNRSVFVRCRLQEMSAGTAAPLALAPRIIVRANNLNLRSGPSTSFERLGQASNGDQFELLGRNEEATWVQGCCFNGRIVWMAARFVETSVPLAAVPLAEDLPSISTADEDLESEGETPGEIEPTDIDVGTAIVATATVPVVTVWRQDLYFVAHLEVTQEPLVSAGEPIEEIRILRHLQEEDRVLDTERTRRFADHEELVDEFPD